MLVLLWRSIRAMVCLFYHLSMSALPMASLVLSFEDARRTVEQHAARIAPPQTETVALLRSSGRVLAREITADRDFPPFPRSTRDGYAVRSADLVTGSAKLKLIGEIKAGPADRPRAIDPGETYSIMTGAPVPGSADAVVMVEYTAEANGIVEVARFVKPGENIVPAAAEGKRGDVLVQRGARLNESAIAVAASVGESQINVYQRPSVAILSTGDELVELDQQPGPAQIRNSNTYSLAAQIQQAGGEPVILPVAPDEPCRLRELIERGLHSDLLIMTGGVSMGRYDLVEQVLSDLHAEFFFTGAQIQPGRPVVFGRVAHDEKSRESAETQRKYFFGLPGNPVSTMVTFELFARPMLEAIAGMTVRKLSFVHARTNSEIRVKPGLTRFLPAILSGDYDRSHVELVPWQGSGDIAAQARANCYAVIPPDREIVGANEWVAILPR